jgi:hypothetical protein
MTQSRRVFMIGVGLALPLVSHPAWAQFGGLTSMLGGGGSNVDPGAFAHHITIGTMAFMRSLAAMNKAIGHADQAAQLQAFVDSSKGADMTRDQFKQAQDLASQAAIPSGAQISASKKEASKLVGTAWVFATLAGYSDKLAVDDAKALTTMRSPNPRVLAVLPFAGSAVTALPGHIQATVTILAKTTSYMTSNGVQKVSGTEANRMVAAAIPNASDVMDKAFSG